MPTKWGGDHVHIIRNETGDMAQTLAVQFYSGRSAAAD
jgi:hypothetical protein